MLENIDNICLSMRIPVWKNKGIQKIKELQGLAYPQEDGSPCGEVVISTKNWAIPCQVIKVQTNWSQAWDFGNDSPAYADVILELSTGG